MRFRLSITIVEGLMTLVLFAIGSAMSVQAQEQSERQEEQPIRTHLVVDQPTVQNKGYTLAVNEEKFRIGIPKGTFQNDVVVTMEKVAERGSEVFGDRQQVSDVYMFNVDHPSDPEVTGPLWFTLEYEPADLRSVSLYYWDDNRGGWTRLPSWMDRENHRVKGPIHLTYARLTLFAEDQAAYGFDPSLRERGLTVGTPDHELRVGVLPGVLSQDANVLLTLRGEQEFPAPKNPHLQRVSRVYSLEVRPTAADQPIFSQPLPFSVEYQSQTGRERQIYFYDQTLSEWRPLPSQDVAEHRMVHATTEFTYQVLAVFERDDTFEGRASWYRSGRYTHAGATHLYPLGSRVRVTNTENGRSVDVEIVSTWGEPDGRVIDITSTAFKELAPLSEGTVSVRIEPINP